MKGINLIKRMPLHLQKEFAREFVRQKSKRKLIQYLKKDFDSGYCEFHEFIDEGFLWDKTANGWNYWCYVQLDEKYTNALPPKPTKKHFIDKK